MEFLVVVISILCLLLLSSVGYIGYTNIKKFLEERLHGISNQIAGNSEYLTSLKDIQDRQKNQEKALKEIIIHLQKFDAPRRKNDIEKTEIDDVPIDESMRIPIVNGVKVRVDNDTSSFPIDIVSYGQD